jgi:MFS family permease
LGGLILQVASWNYIFWINVPIGILAWIFGSRALPKEKGRGKISDVDFKGGSQMFAVIVLLFLALNFGQTLGWTNVWIIAAAVLGGGLFISFILTERKIENPLLDLGIFKSKLFTVSIVMALLNFTVAMFSSILLPFYLQDFKSYGPGAAGLIMMAYPVAMLIFSPIGGSWADKADKEIVTFVGITGIVFSQVGYLLINPHSQVWLVAVILLVQGAAMGIFQSPNNAMVMGTVERKYLGIAGSVNSLARNLAFVLGTSLATLILFSAMSSQMGHKVTTYLPDQPNVFLDGFHVAFYFSTFLVLMTWVMGLMRLIGRKKG